MRLPTDTRTVQPTSEVGAVRRKTTSPVFAAANQIAAALDNSADRAYAVSVRAQEQEQKRANVAAGVTAAETRAAWTVNRIKAESETPEDPTGFSERLLKGFDDDTKTRIENAPENQREHLQNSFAVLRADLLGQATAFEAVKQIEAQKAGLLRIVDTQANVVRSDSTQWTSAMADVEKAYDGSSLADKEAAKRSAKGTMAEAMLQGLNERDTVGAAKLLSSGQFDDVLTPKQKNNLVNDNQTEQRRREAEAEQRRRQAAADQRAMVSDVKVEAASAMMALNMGVVYSGLDGLISRAEKIDPRTAATLKNAKADQSWMQGLRLMPPADIATEVDRTVKAASSSENPEVAAALASRAERGGKIGAHAVQALSKDPLGYAEASGAVPPTSLLSDMAVSGGDEGKIDAAMTDRRRAVESAKARYGVDVPFLKPAEIDQLGKVFETGDSGSKASALSLLARLPPEDVRPVLKAWKEDKPDLVAAVGLTREAPAAAEASVRGRTVREQQPRTLPLGVAKTTMMADLDQALSPLNARPDVRRQAEESILNVFADLQMQAGDLSQTYGGDAPARLKRAAGMVLGEAVEWNGANVLPPSLGTTQEQFDSLMNGLPEDKPMAFTASGHPVTGAAIRRWGKLEGVGQGQYTVRFDSGYAVDEAGRPFVLDLRGKR